MRILFSLIAATFTILLIICLHTRVLLPAPLGKLLSPQEGIWQNAEPIGKDFNADLKLDGLKAKVKVYFDERLVPHVFAENEEDLFFVQGYLHAKFRLWQMDFQTRAAAGRLSEILGPGPAPANAILNFDRDMRRLGMVYAAEKSTTEVEKDPVAKMAIESYSNGVNFYIDHLPESELPIEYKLLGYKPERWSTIRSALFVKYMCLDLAGGEDDIELTNARNIFTEADFDKIYPIVQNMADPVVPRNTVFDKPSLSLKAPGVTDSLYNTFKDTIPVLQNKPDKNNGSNNWAIGANKSKSGHPILCNDPHLGLNMPSLWYEMQLSTPSYNAYGVSFPGGPCIIIGFNDNCAWGITNSTRDVRDYYHVVFKDENRQEYWFNQSWQKANARIEEIKVRDAAAYYDTVVYNSIWPVIYDRSYSGNGRASLKKNYAVRWKPHDPSNEFRFFYNMNHAKNYQDYFDALQYFEMPGQNMLFADKSGDIAIWQQGEFPAKWKRQGDFVMPGTDSSFFWQGIIPRTENPHLINPERGFVSSANQVPTDTSYPYYLGGGYPLFRGLLINRRLTEMNNITVDDMKKLQTDNYNILAEMGRPLLLKYIDESKLDEQQRKYLKIVRDWNLRNDPSEKGATIFSNWWDNLETQVWSDELHQTNLPTKWPEEGTLLEALLRDSAFSFIDNITTPKVESLQDQVTIAFMKMAGQCRKLETEGKLEWAKFKDSGLRHLLRLEPFSRFHLPAGGGATLINAIKQFHGPSWRMIVHLDNETEAYGVYPGGQSGNPGSPYYDNFVNSWVKGIYFKLWMMKPQETKDNRIKWIINFGPPQG